MKTAAAMLLSLALTACVERAPQNSAPSAEEIELANEIVWDDAFGMSGYARPRVSWAPACGIAERGGEINGACWGWRATPAGIEIQWGGAISKDNAFVFALFEARARLLSACVPALEKTTSAARCCSSAAAYFDQGDADAQALRCLPGASERDTSEELAKHLLGEQALKVAAARGLVAAGL